MLGVWQEEEGGGWRGKSIGCVRNDRNGLNFLTGHQKVVLHLKARIDFASAWHILLEKLKGYLLGEFARYFPLFLFFMHLG